MLAKLAAYAIALVTLSLIELPFFPITMSIAMGLRKVKPLSPLVTFLIGAVKMCAAVLLASWLIQTIGLSPSWLMFMIPGYLMVQNDIMRINRVKRGRSNVGLMLEATGEAHSYDNKHDMRMERAHLAGDLIGWIAGTNIALRSAPFF